MAKDEKVRFIRLALLYSRVSISSRHSTIE